MDGKETACQCKRILANAMQEMQVLSLGKESPGEGTDNPLQYSRLENPMDRGAWWASLWGRKELDMTEQLNTYTHTHTHLVYIYKLQNVMYLRKEVDGPPPG